jgi:hypothetical protein
MPMITQEHRLNALNSYIMNFRSETSTEEPLSDEMFFLYIKNILVDAGLDSQLVVQVLEKHGEGGRNAAWVLK